MEWAVEQRKRAIEVSGRSQLVGKCPLEDFVLDSISNNVDVIEELKAFQEHVSPSHAKDLHKDRQNRIASESAIPVVTQQQEESIVGVPMDIIQAVVVESSTPTPGVESNASTMSGEQHNPQEPLTTKSMTDEPPTDTTWITGRPNAIFDPSKALTVKERNKDWTFFLAHQNLCPLRFKRTVSYLKAVIIDTSGILATIHPCANVDTIKLVVVTPRVFV